MAYCIPKDKVMEFKKALRSGEIDPQKLADMETSEARRKYLEKFVGEDAIKVNALFESKMLLKNQKAGYIAWAKKVAGVSPEAKRDLVSKIERMTKVLTPKEEGIFLQDLASTKLGVGVTETEAKKITELSGKITELKTATDPTKPDIKLGRAKLDLTDYVNKLGGKKADLLTNIAGVPRSVMASLDLSAPLNQGWGMISRKQFYTSLGTMFKSARSPEAFRDLQAWMITHPKYDVAKRAGLRLTDLGDKLEMREEQFMSTLLDKFPGISASQRAYTAFLNKIRLDSFVDFIKKAEVAGENVSIGSQASKDIASMVNNFTGGARVGKIEGAVPLLNSTFFSPRKITSTIQMMNPLNYVSPKISPTARKEATRNIIGSLVLSASAIGLYGLLTGRKQETDPTSSDFGKIRAGDTRLDVSGGNATYLNLLSRIITGKIKGSSGISRELGTGYGQTSGWDLLAQFIRYKLSPNASLLVDAVSGANAIGEKKTPLQSVIDRFKPMFINSVVELLKSDTDGKFALALAGLLGAGLNTYNQEINWENSTGKELLQFRSKVGDQKFKEANDEFNKQYDEWFKKTSETDEYRQLSDDGKQSLITKSKDSIKSKIFKQYNFKYKEEKKTIQQKQESKTIEKLKSMNPFSPKEAMASELDFKTTPEEQAKLAKFEEQITKYDLLIGKRKASKLISPEDITKAENRKKEIEKEKDTYIDKIKYPENGIGTWYDPIDPNQTKENPDGKGAYGRKIESGSVAFGNRKYQERLKKGEIIYVRIKGFENVKTPYGMGVFRIDDTMNERYKDVNKIDFAKVDMPQIKEKTGLSGKFNIRYGVIDYN